MSEVQKRQHLTMRVTQEMRDRIEAAAARNGRSRSQEMELRLEQSLRADEGLGGPEQADLMRRIELVMDAASSALGEAWWKRHVAWRLLHDCMDFLLNVYEPAPLPELREALSAEGLAKVDEWKKAATGDAKANLYFHREREQLEFKKRVLGIDERDEARLRELAKITKNADPVLPDLDPEDMAAWLQHEEQRVWGGRMWAAIEPILRAAMETAPKGSFRRKRKTAS
jgi:hypothetical protein